MQHATASSSQRGQSEQARMRALVRFNSLVFQTIVAASFLETAVPAQATRWAQRFAVLPDARLWFEGTWWPQRAETGRELRGYVEAVWPEFDWSAAYEEFQAGGGARYGGPGRDTIALDALALCVQAAQTALLYRTLARCADEPVLRELAARAAVRHAGHFDFFRALHERVGRSGGWLAAWRTIRETCRVARDTAVPAALQSIEHNWSGPPIVPDLPYPELRVRLSALVMRHAGLGVVQRVLFRPWLERAQAAPAAPAIAWGERSLRIAQQMA